MRNSDKEISINDTPEFKLASFSSIKDSSCLSSSKKPEIHSEQKFVLKTRNNLANDSCQKACQIKKVVALENYRQLVTDMRHEIEVAHRFNSLLTYELRMAKQLLEDEIKKRCFDSNLMLKLKSPLYVLYERLCIYHGLPVSSETMDTNIQELLDRYTQSCHTPGCTSKCNENIEQLNWQLEESKKMREKVVGGLEEIIACLADKINTYEKLLDEKQRKESGVDPEKTTVKNLAAAENTFFESIARAEKKIEEFKGKLKTIRAKFVDHKKIKASYSQLLTKLKLMKLKIKSEVATEGSTFDQFKSEADAYWKDQLSFYFPGEDHYDKEAEIMLVSQFLLETYFWLQRQVDVSLMTSFNAFTHKNFTEFEKICKYHDGYSFAVAEIITDSSNEYAAIINQAVLHKGIEGVISAVMQKGHLEDFELTRKFSGYSKFFEIIRLLFTIDINGN